MLLKKMRLKTHLIVSLIQPWSFLSYNIPIFDNPQPQYNTISKRVLKSEVLEEALIESATRNIAVKCDNVYTCSNAGILGPNFSLTGFSATNVMSPNLSVPGNHPGPLKKS